MFAAILMSKSSYIEPLTMYGKFSHLQLEIFLRPLFASTFIVLALHKK